MIRGIEFYIFVWFFVAIGIIGFRELSGKEKWQLAKVLIHSGIYAVIALIIVVSIVVIF